MCSKEATSVRRGLVNDSCLDDAPSAPSPRLPSPRKKKTVKFTLGRNSSGGCSIKVSKRDRLLMSPEGLRGILKISDELKDLLDTLPSSEKGEKSALVDMNSGKGTKPGSHRDWLDTSSHSGGSVASQDTMPTLPSRLLSPELQKGAINISGQAKELLVLDNLPSSDHPIIQATPAPSPVDATIWVEDTDMDFRELVLTRIPEDVKYLLSKDQWYRILEQPSVNKGARGSNSVCSDVTDCDWSELKPIEWEHEERKAVGNEEESAEKDHAKKEKDDDETKVTLSSSCCSASQSPSCHQANHVVEDLQMMGSTQDHEEPCLLNEVSLLLAMDTIIF
jgi:hypothetical protein